MPHLDHLVHQLEQAYQRKAWHGPNLRGTLRGVSAELAGWRPAPERHNIWELTLHCAYWKYAAWRRLTGGKRGSFPLEGSNWFPRPAAESGNAETATRWRAERALLTEQHRTLVNAVRELDPERLDQPSAKGSVTTCAELIFGVAAHDVYHAGQIQMLKRLSTS